MRLVLTASLLLFAALQQQPNPHIRTGKPTVHEGDAKGEADDEQQELKDKPAITIQECERCAIIEKCVGCSAVGDPHAEASKTDSYDPRHDSLYRAYLGFTIFGVVVALGGILAIYKQTSATKDAAVATQISAEAALRSAQATERSVKLQENTQRQWVDLRGWQVHRIGTTDPLEIEFRVANPTGLPLTLHGIVVTVNGKRIDENAPIVLITPNDPFPHGIAVSLSTEQEELYARNALSFEIECTVLFADSHNIHWGQNIGCRLLCGKTGKPTIAITKNKLYESGVPGERGSREVELPK